MNSNTQVGIRLAIEGADRAAKDLGRVSSGLDRIGQSAVDIKGALGGLAGVLSVSAMAAFVKSSIDAADEVSKLAQKTGLAVEQVSGLRLAFEQAGAGDAFATSMAKLGRAVAENNPALAAMGINVRTASGALLGTREALAAVAEKFAGYADGTEKVALAQKLLGKSGADLIPLLNGGAQALEEYDQKAQRLGLTLSTETAKAAERFNDTMDLLSQSTKGAGLRLATELLPVLNVLATALQEASKEGTLFDLVVGGISNTLEAVSVVAAETLYVIKQTGDTLGGVAAGYKEFFLGNFEGVREIGRQMRENGELARKEVDELTSKILNARRLRDLPDKANAGLNFDAETAKFMRQGRVSVASSLAPVVEVAGAARKAVKALGDEFAAQREAAKGWADAMGDFAKIQRDVENSSAGLSKAQARLLEYLGSTAYAGASEPMRQLALQTAFAAIEAESLAEAIKPESAAIEEAINAWANLVEARQADAQTAQDALAEQRAQNAAIGLSVSALAELEAAKLRDTAASKEQRAALADLIDPTLSLGDAYRAEAQALRDLATEKTTGAAKQLALDSAKEAQAEWQKTADSIYSSLNDALMRGFESGIDFAKNLRDTLVNMFKTLVLRPTIQAIVTPVAGTLTGALGFSGSANAAGGGGSEGDILSTLQSGFSALNGTVSNTIATAFSKFAGSSAGQSMGLSNTGYMAGNMGPVAPGGQLTSMGSSMGTALGVVGNTLAGYAMGSMARSLISNGYSAGKGMDNFQKVGMAVGSAIGGPIVGALIGAGAGVFNQLFGRKLKDSGIQGSFGDQGFSGENFQFLKGGLFRSNKTKTSALDPAMDKAFDAQFAAIRTSTGLMSEVLGIGAEALDGFTKSIKVSFKGLDEKQINEKLGEIFGAISDEMAMRVFDAYEPSSAMIAAAENSAKGITGALDMALQKTLGNDMFGRLVSKIVGDGVESLSRIEVGSGRKFIREGESASEALTRLSTSLINVNGAFDTLGTTLYEISLAGADMASSLIDAFGGMDQFAAATSSYYEAFYSEQERTETALRQLSETLGKLGLALPDAAAEDALAQYRKLVEAQDLNTEAGRNAYAALVTLGGGFAQLVGSTQSLAQAASKLALETSRTETQNAIADMVALFGDLAGAMAEIEPPAQTLVDLFRSAGADLQTVQQALDEALGATAMNPLLANVEQLKTALSTLSSIASGAANINEQIFGLQTGRGDAAAVSLLQNREASLYAELQTSADPGAVAGQLATVTLNRIKLQGQLADKATNDAYKDQFDAATTLAKLDKDNRDAQIAAIKEQISGAQTLLDVASSMKGYLAQLRFGDLSALNPGDQLAAAQGNYASLLSAAQGGDAKAAQNLQGGASDYLKEAQSYYGGATSQYAGIFAAVTSGLEQFGAAPVSDISLMQSQLATLESIQASSIDLQTTVTDTTNQQIAGLVNINAALSQRETQAKQDAADAKAAAQKQIELLQQAVTELKAQVVAQAAIYKAQQEKLESIDASLISLDNTSKATAAAP